MKAFPLVFLISFAGCVAGNGAAPAGSSGPTVAAGPAGFDENTGGIEGLVLDEESAPIAGAIVGIVELQQQVTVDQGGAFSFSRVPPGTYQLAAQMLGFGSNAKRVDVKVGEVTKANFVLPKIEVHQGYHTTFNNRGYFECSWTFVITTGPCFYPVTGTNTSYVPVDPWTNNKRQWDYEVGPGVMTVYNEMTWDKTTAATGDAMSVFLSYQKRSGQHWYCNVAHVNPVTLRWDRSADSLEDTSPGTCTGGGAQLPSAEPKTIPMAAGQILTSRANTGPSNLNGNVGFALQQSFQLYVSVFYWESAPASFTAITDR